MISKVSIRNFKSLRDVQIDLERFTVFVGPNASGKSSILQGLDLLCRAFRQPGDDLAEIRQGMSRGASDGVELAAEVAGQGYRYRPRSQVRAGRTPVANQPWSGEGHGTASDFNSVEWKPWQASHSDQPPLPSSVLLRLEASNLISPNPWTQDPTAIAPDGIGLHTALASMALNDPDSWQALQANLRRIVPTIRRLRHTKSPSVHQPAALLFDTVGADSVPANQVSEGTLLVLGLLAALHASSRPSLVLLDDLDRGLHPKAQKELITLLRGLLTATPDLQLVAATHSPYLLDCMEPSEVRMTHLNDDGSTVCASLTQHPKFRKWKDEFHSGEMWSLFGEKWVVERGVATP